MRNTVCAFFIKLNFHEALSVHEITVQAIILYLSIMLTHIGIVYRQSYYQQQGFLYSLLHKENAVLEIKLIKIVAKLQKNTERQTLAYGFSKERVKRKQHCLNNYTVCS